MNASTPATSGYPGTRSSDFAAAKDNVTDALSRGKEGLANATSTLASNATNDLESLRKDLNSLKDTVSRFMAQAGEVSSSVASQSALPLRIWPRAVRTSQPPQKSRPRHLRRSWRPWVVAIHSARWLPQSWSAS